VVGFQYLYGGEDPAGRDFQDEFYQFVLNGEGIEKSFQLAQKNILTKYKSDTKLKDRIFFYESGGAGEEYLFRRRAKGIPQWITPSGGHFFPAPESDKPVVGFNEAISKILDSIQNGTSITWVKGRKGSGKTTLALQVCKYLAERDYVDDKPLPIIYVPLSEFEKIRNEERKIKDACKLQDHIGSNYGSQELSHEVGKILHYSGKKQRKFCHELHRTRCMIKQKLIEIETCEQRIQRRERQDKGSKDTIDLRKKLEQFHAQLKHLEIEKDRLREFSKSIDFALSPFAKIRGAKLYKSLGKKYKQPWLLVIDGLNAIRFSGGNTSNSIRSFIRGIVNNNEHCRIMICTNLKGSFKLNLNYISQISVDIPLFPLTTKVNLFLNHRPEQLTRMEFGDISREQLVKYVHRSAIVTKLLPKIHIAQGIIDLSKELKDNMLSCVGRMVMNSLVQVRNRYEKLEATGSLPDLIYIDDYQRGLVSTKWTVWARPCERPAVIPKIGLNTAKKSFAPVSLGEQAHYETYGRNKEPGKIGELAIDNKFEDDIVSIVLDGFLQYDVLQIRSPFGVSYTIQQIPMSKTSPVTLKVTQTDTPDENVFYRENNEFGIFWESNIKPTLSLELQEQAQEFRAKTGDGLDGDEEADGTLPLAAGPACIDWDSSEVADFIRDMAPLPEYHAYALAFEQNGISGDLLDTLDEQTLKELGVTSRLHRKVILQKTKALVDL